MAATSVSAAKNRMGRAIDSILDPWPASKDPIWEFFGSSCAYCGVELVKDDRLGHIDHATAGAGNFLGNLVLSCSVCNGDEKLDMPWRAFLEQKIADLDLRAERIAKIQRWQALHPSVELAASPDVVRIDGELREMMTAFSSKCDELRAAVKAAKVATSPDA